MASTNTVHTVSYTLRDGDAPMKMSAEFTHAQAAAMAKTLLEMPQWGDVTSVTITCTDRPIDPRPVAEQIADAERNIIA